VPRHDTPKNKQASKQTTTKPSKNGEITVGFLMNAKPLAASL
jgi:hypothetical protein